MNKHLILTVNSSPWSKFSGGGQLSTHRIALVMQERGYRVDVVYTKPLFSHQTIPKKVPYKVHWASYPSITYNKSDRSRDLSIFGVARKVKKLLTPGCIVHSNGEEGALLGQLKKDHKFKFVVSPRYPNLPSEINPQSPIKDLFFGLHNTKFKLLFYALRDADMVIYTSNFSRELAAERYRGISTKSTVIPNGVDKRFLKHLYKPVNGKKTILFFGRLENDKGLDLIVNSLNNCNANYDQLIVAGNGSLSGYLKKNLPTDKFKNYGWQDVDGVIELMQEATLAVLPSTSESFGNSIAESLGAGLPVITTNYGAIPEITNGIDSEYQVMDKPSSELLCERINYLFANPLYCKKISEKNKRHIEENFSWKKIGAKLDELYQKI